MLLRRKRSRTDRYEWKQKKRAARKKGAGKRLKRRTTRRKRKVGLVFSLSSELFTGFRHLRARKPAAQAATLGIT